MTNTEETPEEAIMRKYLDLVIAALADKARTYREGGMSDKEKFLRVTEIKNAIRGIGKPSTFGISPSYSSCPGECVGGVCVKKTVDVTDDTIKAAAVKLGITPEEL